jgi:hypothetical protein
MVRQQFNKARIHSLKQHDLLGVGNWSVGSDEIFDGRTFLYCLPHAGKQSHPDVEDFVP